MDPPQSCHHAHNRIWRVAWACVGNVRQTHPTTTGSLGHWPILTANPSVRIANSCTRTCAMLSGVVSTEWMTCCIIASKFLNIALAQYESWVLQLKSTAYLLYRYVLHKWLRLWCQPTLAHGSVSQTRKTEWLQLLPRLMPRTLLPALRFLQHASGPSFSFAVAAADRGAPHDSLARKGLSKLADASYVLPHTTLLLGHGQLPLSAVLFFFSFCLLRVGAPCTCSA